MADVPIYQFIVNSINITSYVLTDGTKISLNRQGSNGNDALIFVANTVTSVYTPNAGDEIEIYRGPVTGFERCVFFGNIKKINNDENNYLTFECKDPLQKLKYNIFSKSYDINIDPEAGEASAIFADIAVQGGFPVTVVNSGTGTSDVTLKQFITKRKSRLDRLNLIAKILNWFFYYDYNAREIKLEPKGYTAYTNILTVGDNIINVPSWEQEIEGMRNIITVEGATELDTRQVTFTGDGATKTFSFGLYTPESTRCTVNGVLKVQGVSGTTATYDYTIDVLNKTFTFLTAPTTGHPIVMDFTTRLPRPVTGRSESSIEEYGLEQEEVYNFKDVSTVEDAETRVQQLLSLLEDGDISTEIWSTEFDIFPGYSIPVVDPINPDKSDTYIVFSVLMNYGEAYDIIKIGNEDIDVNSLFMTIDERLRALESPDTNLSEILRQIISSTTTNTISVSECSVTKKTPQNSFILGHPTLGRLRADLNFEADCSNNGNNGTWAGTGINGAQYVNPPYLDSALILDLENNPTAGVVADKSPAENDGELKINATGYYSDATMVDKSTTGNNGTISGAVATTDHLGQTDGALLYDGADDYTSITSRGHSLKFSPAISQDGTPSCLRFKSDGTKMYILGRANDRVYQYTLSTAWDVSTATYDSVSFLISEDTAPVGLAFSTDGSKMYVTGNATDKIYQYTLSTAWNLATASYATKSLDVVAKDNVPIGLCFKSDGTILYFLGDQNNRIYQYALSTAWDISTATYTKYISSGDTTPQDLFIDSSGTKLWVVGSASDLIRYWYLGTAWDIATATLDSIVYYSCIYDTTIETGPIGICFKPDLLQMYYVGSTLDTVIQVPLLTSTYTTSWGEAVKDNLWSNGGSIVAVIKPNSVGETAGRIVDKSYGSAGDRGFAWYVNSNASLGFRISAGTTINTAADSVPFGQWSVVGITWDSTGLTSIYVNGVVSGTPGVSRVANSITTDAAITVGGRTTSTDRTFDGSIGKVLLLGGVTLTAAEMLNMYNTISVHDLDKPLVTKTDSDGNSITGYEFLGKSGYASFGNYLEMSQTDLAAADPYSIYFEIMPVDNWTTINTSANVIGNRVGDGTTIELTNQLKIKVRQDDTDFNPTTLVNAGKVNKVLVEYYRTGANQTWNTYINSLTPETKTMAHADSYGNATFWLAYDSRFYERFNGVISKPIIVNRILTDTERADLFAGKYCEELSPMGRLSCGKFNGTDNYVSMNVVPDLSNSNFSIHAILLPNSGSYKRFISMGDGAINNKLLHIGYISASAFGVGFYNADVSFTVDWDLSTTHHITVTHNTSTLVTELFVDGVSKGTKTHSGAYTGTTVLGYIGRYATNYWSGLIDEVFIFDDLVTENDINLLNAKSYYDFEGDYKFSLHPKIHWSFDNPVTGDYRSSEFNYYKHEE